MLEGSKIFLFGLGLPVTTISEPFVAQIFLDKIFRVVVGAVVANDDFRAGVILVEGAYKRHFKEFRSVVSGNHYADKIFLFGDIFFHSSLPSHHVRKEGISSWSLPISCDFLK